jgi:hypothetical protein
MKYILTINLILSICFTCICQEKYCSKKIYKLENKLFVNYSDELYLKDSIPFPFLLVLGYNKGKKENLIWGNPIIFKNNLLVLNFMRNPSSHGQSEILFPIPIFYRINCMQLSEIYNKVKSEERVKQSNKVIKIKPSWDQTKLLHYDFLEFKNKLYVLLKTDDKILIYAAKDAENVCANEWIFEMKIPHKFPSEYFVAFVTNKNKITLEFETIGKIEIDVSKKKVGKRNTNNANFMANNFYLFDEKNTMKRISKEEANKFTGIDITVDKK